MSIRYSEAVTIARELRASGALPSATTASREKNRARMRIKRNGSDVRPSREWPQLAGLHGYDREAQRKKIVRAEARMFRAARQRWPQLAHLKGAEYKAAWKRASRLFTDTRQRWPQLAHLKGDAYKAALKRAIYLQTRKIEEAAYRRWAVGNS